MFKWSINFINLNASPDHDPVHIFDRLPAEEAGLAVEELEVRLQVQAVLRPHRTGHGIQVGPVLGVM